MSQQETVPNANDYRINIGHVAVSSNNILSFTLKENCPAKIPSKNTYIIKVNSIEMNNLTRIDKVTFENGVYEFKVDLTPIVNALTNGTNQLEVEGTANMLICGAGALDGFYSLSCNQTSLSIYSTNGLYISSDPLRQGIAGCYTRKVVSTDTVIYEKLTVGDKYTIFFSEANNRWFIKQNIRNGVNVNILLFQQKSQGTSDEVPLSDWTSYPAVCGRAGTSLTVKACIPYEGTRLLLVNCGGLDKANGCYYQDTENNRFVNVRDSNFVIVYVVNDSGSAEWQIQQLCSTSDPADCELECVTVEVLYKNRMAISCSSVISTACIPCCNWSKGCSTSPANPPVVTALEYFDPGSARHTIKYFDNEGSTWSFYDGTTQVAIGTCNHYIIQRAGQVSVNGAYAFTGMSPVTYTGIHDSNITLVFSGSRWEVRDGISVLYYNTSTDPSVPPFENWVANTGITEPGPLVLCAIVPSCLTWTLL